jgi:hypothetical protein
VLFVVKTNEICLAKHFDQNKHFLIVLRIFMLLFKCSFKQNCSLTQNKTLFSKKKMDANLRQPNPSSAVWADLTTNFTNSSRNGLLICASNLQVYVVISK